METSRRSAEVGLMTKSTAPARIAEMAVSIEPCAVCTMTGGLAGMGAMRRSTSMPSMPGMTRSSSTRAIEPLSDASHDLDSLLAALGGLGVVAEALDGFFEDAALGGIVVDDQDKLGHGTGTRLN